MHSIMHNKYIVGFLLVFGFFTGISVAHSKTLVDMQTNYGLITLQLEDEIAPITVSNFLTYVDAGFYDGLVFHRIIKGFMSQGGGFNTALEKQATRAPIPLESNVGLQNLRGTIAMARTSVPDSASSQFFINAVDNSFLDYLDENSPGYAVFGKVIAGMEVVDAINQVATNARDLPLETVLIEAVRRREAQLNFAMQNSYRAGDTFTIELEETMARRVALDLWVAVLMPDNRLLFFTEQGVVSTPTAFKTAVPTTETRHVIYSIPVPEGFSGQYMLAAVFNKQGAGLERLTQTLRSNLAKITLEFVQ